MNLDQLDHGECHGAGMELYRQCDEVGHLGDGYVIRGVFPALAGFRVTLTKFCGCTS